MKNFKELLALFDRNLISAHTLLSKAGLSDAEIQNEAQKLTDQRDTIFDKDRVLNRQIAMRNFTSKPNP